MSFYHNTESLYWQRICSLMHDKSTKEMLKTMYSFENAVFCSSENTDVFEDKEFVCIFSGNMANKKTVKEKLRDFNITTSENQGEIFLYIYKALGIHGAGLVFGEFSVVIFGKEKSNLILFRDKTGTVPLYYALTNGRFCFSNSINSLLRFPGVNPVIDEKGVADIFCMPGRNNPKDSFFESIKRVPQGNALIFDKSGIKFKEYYSLKPTDKFNFDFLARDSIRRYGGNNIKHMGEFQETEFLYSAIELTDKNCFPVYGYAVNICCHIKKNRDNKLLFPFLFPPCKESEIDSLLIKDKLKGIDLSRRKNESKIIYGMNPVDFSFDSGKIHSRENRIFDIKTYFSCQGEMLGKFCEMNRKEIHFPLLDGRVTEAYADGGGDLWQLPECFCVLSQNKEDKIRRLVKNELTGERPVFEIIEKDKLENFINSGTIQDIVYLLSIDYFINRFHVTFSLIN